MWPSAELARIAEGVVARSTAALQSNARKTPTVTHGDFRADTYAKRLEWLAPYGATGPTLTGLIASLSTAGTDFT